MSKGIYCFIDEETGIVDYIGRFSNKRRVKEHYYPSTYDAQQINRVLQNNPDRYRAEIICEYPELTDDELNYLEIKEILKHKFLYGEIPRFNFTIGGDGISGFVHTDETKQKISKANTGKTRSEDFKQKRSEYMKGPNNPNWKKNFSSKTREKMGEAKAGIWKKYARIIKVGFINNKQQYALIFRGERYKYSIYPDKLLNWFSKNYPNEILKIPKKDEL